MKLNLGFPNISELYLAMFTLSKNGFLFVSTIPSVRKQHVKTEQSTTTRSVVSNEKAFSFYNISVLLLRRCWHTPDHCNAQMAFLFLVTIVFYTYVSMCMCVSYKWFHATFNQDFKVQHHISLAFSVPFIRLPVRVHIIL